MEFREVLGGDTLANFRHQVKVKVDIVERIKHAGEDLTRHEEMAQVRPGKPPAHGAATSFVNRCGIFSVAGVLYRKTSSACEQISISGVASRQDTIKHVHP